MVSSPTIFIARNVITVDPARPSAEAVAVADGQVLGVGTIEELSVWGTPTIDDTFGDSVLVPGFVEAHAHILEGAMWGFPYIGYFDRMGADGQIHLGLTSIEAVLDRLRQLVAAEPGATEPLVVWGLDPLYFPGERLVARHLDTVSETRPIFVFHASGHLATVNTALMEREGFADDPGVEGVPVDADGRSIGELQEPAAYSLAREAVRILMTALSDPAAIARLGQSARHAGITTLTELGVVRMDLEANRNAWVTESAAADFPIRASVFCNPSNVRQSADQICDFLDDLKQLSTDKLRFGNVKLVLDGSIQGFTARLNPPGYLTGATGIWLQDPQWFIDMVEALHRGRVNVHAHCNGDQAVDLFLDAVERADLASPWRDHRHTVQHCQLTTPAQYRRMAALGMCANIFANHIWYWGDQHYERTVGPDRAARMDACGTAERSGVSYSIHSDANVTPLGHLHTMWCAVNRVTPSGRVLGPEERISPLSALRATTIDAAFQLGMDHEIGSIEPGKFADFTALSDSPLDVDPMGIRDIDIRGTVLGGRVFRD